MIHVTNIPSSVSIEDSTDLTEYHKVYAAHPRSFPLVDNHWMQSWIFECYLVLGIKMEVSKLQVFKWSYKGNSDE